MVPSERDCLMDLASSRNCFLGWALDKGKVKRFHHSWDGYSFLSVLQYTRIDACAEVFLILHRYITAACFCRYRHSYENA